MVQESHLRSVLKGISWRFIATSLLVAIVYFVEGSIETALGVGAIEFVGKFFMYYLHERVWSNYLKGKEQTPRISLYKAISWRIVASLMTMGIVMITVQNGDTTLIVGAVEFVSKFVAYYFHERAWQTVPKKTVRKLLTKK